MHNKKISLFLIALTSVLTFVGSSAAPQANKGFILKQFKELEYELLFESDNIYLDGSTKSIFESSKKMQLYKSIRDKVTEKREQLEEENIRILNKITNLEDSVEILEKDITNIREETIKINNQIIEITKKLTITKETISLLKVKITQNKKILHEYIVYLYQKGNYAFKDGKIDNIKAILFSGEDISSLLNDLYYKGMVEITGKKLIDNHRNFVNDLYVKKLALSKADSESKSLRKQLIVNKAMMKQKKEFKEKLITISQGKQQLYEKFIQEKRATEQSIKTKEFKERLKFNSAKKELLTDEGCDYVDFSRVNKDDAGLSEKCEKLNTIIFIESKLRGFEVDKAGNVLKWPISPSPGITSFFHDPGYMTLFGEDHDALDIRAPQGTPIYAPADGYVVLVVPPVSGGYSFVGLKHSDGLITVYGHLSEVNVEELDIVKAGEEFAKSGGSVGTPGAGLMTTGAHLHFEVWADKQLVDPLNYLDTSVLPVSALPRTHIRKYRVDFKANKGYVFEEKISEKREERTFKITGETEIERQKNFLQNYGVGAFKNWTAWVEQSLEANLDPTFVMCVGLAETSLGKQLKTPFNVGNVGNTDSGDTMTFKSVEDGIDAMVRTFNNRYLGDYDEIQLLSRYGNPDKPIYASSPSNWHNNIVSCMGHIKGRYVSDDYNFRLE